jgi:hypothetical protein
VLDPNALAHAELIATDRSTPTPQLYEPATMATLPS